VTTTRWLSDSEQQSWRAYLESTKILFDLLDRQLQRDSNMPHAYWEILVRLGEVDGRSMRMSELADATRSSRSRLSHAVARLEERGWVERHNCETDRRGQLAVLTDAGYAVLAEAAPGHVATVRKLLVDELGDDDFAELGRISERVLAHLEAFEKSPEAEET
jgi:DNA-binding MarR family transcriptional regulator